LNRTEPNPDRHDCRAKNAIQTRAAAVVQRNSREAGIVQARLPRLRGVGVKAAWRARGSAEGQSYKLMSRWHKQWEQCNGFNRRQ
jgi:hypothetical protein